MSIPRGDFIGFTYGGIHSSELNIIRTSEGSRFKKDLLPSFNDKIVEVPGGDGGYFFGTTSPQKHFQLLIAYDMLTESQIREMEELFSPNVFRDLIFDEEPYKVYRVKLASPPSLSFIPFTEKEERIYKGEGSLQFISISPYARSRFKYEEDYTIDNIPEWVLNENNLTEWILASKIQKKGNKDVFSKGKINLYNAGVLETDYKLTIPFTNGKIEAFQVFLDAARQLNFNLIEKQGEDIAIIINSKTNLIEGVNGKGERSGNIYNQYKKSGFFFKIPLGDSEMTVTTVIPSGIEYDYLYY